MLPYGEGALGEGQIPTCKQSTLIWGNLKKVKTVGVQHPPAVS